jgi:hypothetical protein
MSGTTSSQQDVGTSIPRQSSREAPVATGWVGWIGFAGSLMVMLGSFHAIEGLIALFKDDYFLVTRSGLTIDIDYTAWGWAHLAAGAILIFAGIGLFSGQMWARVVGVAVAMLSALVNFSFLAAYPFWSSIMIAVDILVIWALTAHGREMQSV